MLTSISLLEMNLGNFNFILFLLSVLAAFAIAWHFLCHRKETPFEYERKTVIGITAIAALPLLFCFWQEAKGDSEEWLQGCYDGTYFDKCDSSRDIEKKYKKLTGEEIRKTDSEYLFN